MTRLCARPPGLLWALAVSLALGGAASAQPAKAPVVVEGAAKSAPTSPEAKDGKAGTPVTTVQPAGGKQLGPDADPKASTPGEAAPKPAPAQKPATPAEKGPTKPATPPPVAKADPKPGDKSAKPPESDKKPETAKPPQTPECQRLDAANDPRCAGRGLVASPPPGADTNATPAPAGQPPAGGPPSAAKVPPPGAKPAPCPKGQVRPAGGAACAPKPAPTPVWLQLVQKNPLLAGGAAGLALLLLGGGAWWLLARGRRGLSKARASRSADRPPTGTPPTPYRRDLVLVDEGEKAWRFAGAALHPNLTLGADATAAGFLAGDEIALRHAQVWVEDGRLVLRRAGEAPVFLNDRLLADQTPEVVSTGDTIRLGGTTFRVAID